MFILNGEIVDVDGRLFPRRAAELQMATKLDRAMVVSQCSEYVHEVPNLEEFHKTIRYSCSSRCLWDTESDQVHLELGGDDVEKRLDEDSVVSGPEEIHVHAGCSDSLRLVLSMAIVLRRKGDR